MAGNQDLRQALQGLITDSIGLTNRARAALDMLPEADPDPEWFKIAQADVGVVREIPGKECHPRIAEAQALTRYREPHGDETPWCSAFMCLWMHEVGLPHTASAAARSWLKYGAECELQRGAIVVLWRGDPNGHSGHVGLALNWDKDNVTLIGGNQGNSVSSKQYPRSRILRVCMPDVS